MAIRINENMAANDTHTMIQGFGVKVGKVVGSLARVSPEEPSYDDLRGKVVVVESPAQFKTTVNAGPAAVLAPFGGPLSHLAKWSLDRECHVGLGFSSQALNCLDEEQTVTLQNDVFDTSSLFVGRHDGNYLSNETVSFSSPVWLSSSNSRIATRLGKMAVAGLGIVRLENILPRMHCKISAERNIAACDSGDLYAFSSCLLDNLDYRHSLNTTTQL